jgi:hypothetical protein
MRIAARHAEGFYVPRGGPGYTLSLRARLQHPPGGYFLVAYPSPLATTGDGGFFVSLSNGRIVHLGSGDLHSLWDWRTSPHPTEAEVVATIEQAVRTRLSGPE